MFEALSDLVGKPLSLWSRMKASLPSSLGGVGIRLASQHAAAAYIASVCQSQSLVASILGYFSPQPSFLPSAIQEYASAAGRSDWVSLEDIEPPLRQRPLSRAVDQAIFDIVLESAPDIRSKAIVLSSSIRHAGDWLNVIPSTALGLHLTDVEFRLCLKYWLGLSMFEEGASCPVCSSDMDSFGDHSVGCGGNGDRIFRHDVIRDTLFSAAQSAALAPRKEVPSLVPGTCSRPADLYLPNWKHGRPAALDVTVISTLQQQTVSGASSTPGFALTVGENRKNMAHFDACQAVGVHFIPLVFETLGGISDQAISTIKSIGRHLGLRFGSLPAEVTSHLFQRLSISLWRGNSIMWMRRTPVQHPYVDGIV